MRRRCRETSDKRNQLADLRRNHERDDELFEDGGTYLERQQNGGFSGGWVAQVDQTSIAPLTFLRQDNQLPPPTPTSRSAIPPS